MHQKHFVPWIDGQAQLCFDVAVIGFGEVDRR